ncbi:polymer-forming cytoskeletal protein [Salinicola endophyticus]|uniref:Polymer-forming cytoskeletal protein n=1 Tax=Salinicola endophyticus TaxID=1949083 RepID=A0AB74U184_9GAMM
MDLGEWLLLGGLGCCLLLLLDGYRRARGRRERVLTAQSSSSLQATRIESPQHEAQPMPAEVDASSSCPPAPSPQPAAPSPSLARDSAATLIGASVRVIGDIDCAESIRVEGRLDGTLAADEHDVVIGSQAEVGPRLRAGTLRISGRVSGEQRVKGTAMIAPGARVQGTLKAHRLQCDEGASLSGNVNVGGPRVGNPPR